MRNLLTNSSFDVWQRGTSFATSTRAFGSDRWSHRRGLNAADGTISRQTGFNGSKYCCRIARDNGTSGVDVIGIGQQLESDIVRRIAGRYVRLAFDVRAGANFSGAASSLSTCQISTGTAENETFGDATFPTGNANQFPILLDAVISTTIKRVVTPAVLIASNALSLWVGVGTWIPVGTAGAADYVEVANVQLEDAGSDGLVPWTDYEARTFEDEIRMCRRFYEKSFALDTAPAQNAGADTDEHHAVATIAGANANRLGYVPFVVGKFKDPTITLYNPAAANAEVRDRTNSVDFSSSAAANISRRGFKLTATGNAATTVGADAAVHWVANAEI